jgi:Ca2+/Na+ antiporter
MKDFDHLMSVWQGQPKKDQLSVDDVLKQVKKGIRSLTSRMYWSIMAMAIIIVFAFLITFFGAFNSWVTTVGILIVLATMLMYLSMIIRHYHKLSKRDATLNPSEYLDSLKEYQKNRTKVIGWFYYMYILLISGGLSLYFIEVLQNASAYFKLPLTALYFLVAVYHFLP